jgi:hypothetical protein
MSPRQYEDAPYPLMTVLDAVVKSLDGRFKQVPNGNIEVAWRQARKTKGSEAPPRYFVGIEFAYVPDARDTLTGSSDE